MPGEYDLTDGNGLGTEKGTSAFIRVLAARDMNRKERLRYGKVKETFAKDPDV